VTRLYVVRHARTAWTGRRYCGRTDVPLTSAGRRDATALGSRLASIAGGALVRTSPLRRAVETAALIARGGPFWVDERLREIDFGAAEGLSFAELARRWPDLGATLASGGVPAGWPEGESWSDCRARATALREELRDREGDTILVTHAFVARALLEGTCLPIDLAPAQLSVVELDVAPAPR